MKRWKRMSRRVTAASMAAVLTLSNGVATLAVTEQGNEGASLQTSALGTDSKSTALKATSSNAEKDTLTSSVSGSSQKRRTATGGNAEKPEMDSVTTWTLMTERGTLKADGSESEVTQLQKNKGSYTNGNGDVLYIDASSGKFAMQANRTQVNPGTKITMPVSGKVCRIQLDAHKDWRGSGSTEEQKLNGAMQSIKVEGVLSCVAESIETAQDDNNYEIYTYLCFLEEGAESVTLEVTIPFKNSAYLRSITREAVEVTEVNLSGTVTLPASTEVPDNLVALFESETTGIVYEASIVLDGETGNYQIPIPVLESDRLTVKLNDERYQLADKDVVISLDSSMTEETFDFEIEEVKMSEVTGSILGLPQNFDTSNLEVVFTPQESERPIPEVEMSGTSYSALLENGVSYTVSLKGADDYELIEPNGTVTVDTATTLNLSVEEKENYLVTIQWSGLSEEEQEDFATYNIKYVFTDENGNRKEFSSLDEETMLRDGIWTLSLEQDIQTCPYEIQSGGTIVVNGQAVSKKVKLGIITTWNLYKNAAENPFTGDIQNRIDYFRGLGVNAENGGKLTARDGDAQFNKGTVIAVPVKGDCKITVTAYGPAYALYTIDGVPASTTEASTTVEYVGGSGYVYIESTGTSYICSISLLYPPKDVEIKEQEVMPSIAEFGSPANLSVEAEGQTLRLTQVGGKMAGKESLDSSISYYLFPSTEKWDSLSADIVVEKGETSTSSGIFVGAFDGTYLTTTGIRGLTGLRGIYSKTSAEHAGAGGTNKTVTEGSKLHFHVQKNADGLGISVTSDDGLEENYTYKYSNMFQFKPNGEATEVQYGFAVTSATVAITNMLYQDAEGNVLYDQNDCYQPEGEAPTATSITAQAAESREFIHVSWTGEECDADGYYVLQVSRDGETWEDVSDTLKSLSYDYPISEAGDYYFRVCGTLGNNSTEADRNAYVAMETPVHVIAALTAPTV